MMEINNGTEVRYPAVEVVEELKCLPHHSLFQFDIH